MEYDCTLNEKLEHAGLQRVDEQPDLDAVCDHLRGAFEAMYETGDVYALESCLDEMAYHLGVKMNPGEPKIQKKQPISALEWLRDYQRETMDMMKGN